MACKQVSVSNVIRDTALNTYTEAMARRPVGAYEIIRTHDRLKENITLVAVKVEIMG